MRSQTGFTGEMLSDPENKIAAMVLEDYGLKVAITEKKGYEHGMAQPAVLVLQKDGTVLYKWAIDPGVVSQPAARCCGQVWNANFLPDELGRRIRQACLV